MTPSGAMRMARPGGAPWARRRPLDVWWREYRGGSSGVGAGRSSVDTSYTASMIGGRIGLSRPTRPLGPTAVGTLIDPPAAGRYERRRSRWATWTRPAGARLAGRSVRRVAGASDQESGQ